MQGDLLDLVGVPDAYCVSAQLHSSVEEIDVHSVPASGRAALEFWIRAESGGLCVLFVCNQMPSIIRKYTF